MKARRADAENADTTLTTSPFTEVNNGCCKPYQSPSLKMTE